MALILIGLLIFFCIRRRRDDEYEGDNSSEMMVDDVAYEEALRSSKNPFADQDSYANPNSVMLGRRRLSDGSLADAADYNHKVLRVANPDDN